MTTYYLIPVFGCVEPEVKGPYIAESEQDAMARAIHAEQDETDALFWMYIDDQGVPTVGSYPANFFGAEDSGP